MQFNDKVVSTQLKTLDRRHDRLPSVIFDLLAQKPPVFSENDMTRYRESIPGEQWRAGLMIKSDWQNEVAKQFRPAAVAKRVA